MKAFFTSFGGLVLLMVLTVIFPPLPVIILGAGLIVWMMIAGKWFESSTKKKTRQMVQQDSDPKQ
jgi:cation transport ATPase